MHVLSSIFLFYASVPVLQTYKLNGEQSSRFFRKPWKEPYNRLELYYYGKNCPDFPCPGLNDVCARIGNGTVFLDNPKGCVPINKVCYQGQVKLLQKRLTLFFKPCPLTVMECPKCDDCPVCNIAATVSTFTKECNLSENIPSLTVPKRYDYIDFCVWAISILLILVFAVSCTIFKRVKVICIKIILLIFSRKPTDCKKTT